MVGDSRRRGILFIHILFRMNQNKARMRSIIYKPLAKEGEKKLRWQEKKKEDKDSLANVIIGSMVEQ
jgi:hypothetical protein